MLIVMSMTGIADHSISNNLLDIGLYIKSISIKSL